MLFKVQFAICKKSPTRPWNPPDVTVPCSTSGGEITVPCALGTKPEGWEIARFSNIPPQPPPMAKLGAPRWFPRKHPSPPLLQGPSPNFATQSGGPTGAIAPTGQQMGHLPGNRSKKWVQSMGTAAPGHSTLWYHATPHWHPTVPRIVRRVSPAPTTPLGTIAHLWEWFSSIGWERHWAKGQGQTDLKPITGPRKARPRGQRGNLGHASPRLHNYCFFRFSPGQTGTLMLNASGSMGRAGFVAGEAGLRVRAGAPIRLSPKSVQARL